MDHAPTENPPATPDMPGFPVTSSDLAPRAGIPVDPAFAAQSWKIAVAGLAAGILADLLLRASPLGAGLLVWVGAVALLTAVASRCIGIALRRQVLVPALFAVACTAEIVWRDSPFLRTMDCAFLATCAAAAVLEGRSHSLRAWSVIDVPVAVLLVALHAVSGAARLPFREIDWLGFGRARGSRETRAVLRGLLIALPLVFIFGKLFISADLQFEALVRSLFAFDLRELIGHALVTALWTWIMIGSIRRAFRDDTSADTHLPEWRPLGTAFTPQRRSSISCRGHHHMELSCSAHRQNEGEREHDDQGHLHHRGAVAGCPGLPARLGRRN